MSVVYVRLRLPEICTIIGRVKTCEKKISGKRAIQEEEEEEEEELMSFGILVFVLVSVFSWRRRRR